jgi:hypothetical protein
MGGAGVCGPVQFRGKYMKKEKIKREKRNTWRKEKRLNKNGK